MGLAQQLGIIEEEHRILEDAYRESLVGLVDSASPQIATYVRKFDNPLVNQYLRVGTDTLSYVIGCMAGDHPLAVVFASPRRFVPYATLHDALVPSERLAPAVRRLEERLETAGYARHTELTQGEQIIVGQVTTRC